MVAGGALAAAGVQVMEEGRPQVCPPTVGDVSLGVK